MTAAERLRIVHQLIIGLPKQTSLTAGACAGITPNKAPFTRVTGLFPPHDPEFNAAWLKRWTSSSSLFSIPEAELDKLRNHFGESIACKLDSIPVRV